MDIGNKQMKKKLIAAWKKYHDKTGLDLRTTKADAFKWFDAELLYSFIRITKPKKIIEMSPDKGWSTEIMIKAINDNKQKCEIFSFDIRDFSQKWDQDNEYVFRKLILGNAQETVSKYLKDCDFMFIDSDHSYDFGKWYSNLILPELDDGVYVWIHDWPTFESDGWSGEAILSPSGSVASESYREYHSGDFRQGEPKAVKEYFKGTPILNTTTLFQELNPGSNVIWVILNDGALSQIWRK